MGRAAENGAGAIVHQDEVCDVDRQGPCRVQRVNGTDAGIEPFFLSFINGFLGSAGATAFRDKVLECRIIGSSGSSERVIGGDGHEFGTEQGVGAGCVNLEFVHAFWSGRGIEREADHQAFRPPDPVALHEADLFGPAIQGLKGIVKLLSHIGNFEKPLGQFALFDKGAGAPAAAFNDLLVCENGMVDGIPIDLRGLSGDEISLEEIEEHALLMAVIGGVAGGDFAFPVEGEAHGLQLGAHGGDIGVGPGGRMGLVGHGGVLCRHAERVPPHRV